MSQLVDGAVLERTIGSLTFGELKEITAILRRRDEPVVDSNGLTPDWSQAVDGIYLHDKRWSSQQQMVYVQLEDTATYGHLRAIKFAGERVPMNHLGNPARLSRWAMENAPKEGGFYVDGTMTGPWFPWTTPASFESRAWLTQRAELKAAAAILADFVLLAGHAAEPAGIGRSHG